MSCNCIIPHISHASVTWCFMVDNGTCDDLVPFGTIRCALCQDDIHMNAVTRAYACREMNDGGSSLRFGGPICEACVNDPNNIRDEDVGGLPDQVRVRAWGGSACRVCRIVSLTQQWKETTPSR